jgi:hypothetical protein
MILREIPVISKHFRGLHSPPEARPEANFLKITAPFFHTFAG